MSFTTPQAQAAQAAGDGSIRPVRIGVIGVGRIGRMHAELLARRVVGAAVGAVYDAYEPAAAAVGAQLGVPVAVSVDAILASDLDAVAICSSADTHADLVVAAAGAGKPIFCEKPISLELAEVDRVLAAVESAGVSCQVGFNRRFDPSHAVVREAVASGAIGEPHLVRISSRDPEPPPLDYIKSSGGLFLDMTIHDFDMARFLTGSEVVEVFARGAVRVEPSYAQVGDIDTAAVTLVHEDGTLTMIDNSRGAVYGYDQRIEVFGSRGMAVSENPPLNSSVLFTADGSHGPVLPRFFINRYVAAFEREWQAFADSVRSGTPPPVGVRDARAPLVIGLAALRSLSEGRAVKIEEVDRS